MLGFGFEPARQFEIELGELLIGQLDLAQQSGFLLLEFIVMKRLVHRGAQRLVVPGLGQVFVHRTAIHRIDHGIQIGMAGEHHAHHIRMALAHLGE